MSNTVVCVRADEAADRIAAFVAHAGSDVTNRGTLDGVRRFEVDAAAWAAYTRAVCGEPVRAGRPRLPRCGDCRVETLAPGLTSHQRATGHAGRAEVRP